MMMKLKVVAVILILILAFIGVSTLHSASITVKSKGKAHASYNGSVYSYGCDNTDDVECSITIVECHQVFGHWH